MSRSCGGKIIKYIIALLIINVLETRWPPEALTALGTRAKWTTGATARRKISRGRNGLNWCGLGFCAGSLFEWDSPTQKQQLQSSRRET